MCPREIIKYFFKEIICSYVSAHSITSRSCGDTTPNWFRDMTANTETFHKLTRPEIKETVFQYHSAPHDILLGPWMPYVV